MQRLQGAAARAYQDLLACQPTTPGKVAFAWCVAAGPVLGRAATVHWTEDGTLSVVARGLAWQREISCARPIIAQRLAQLLGPAVVRNIVIHVGAFPGAGERANASAPTRAERGRPPASERVGGLARAKPARAGGAPRIR